jgi:hypothetical protein
MVEVRGRVERSRRTESDGHDQVLMVPTQT